MPSRRNDQKWHGSDIPCRVVLYAYWCFISLQLISYVAKQYRPEAFDIDLKDNVLWKLRQGVRLRFVSSILSYFTTSHYSKTQGSICETRAGPNHPQTRRGMVFCIFWIYFLCKPLFLANLTTFGRVFLTEMAKGTSTDQDLLFESITIQPFKSSGLYKKVWRIAYVQADRRTKTPNL